MSNGCVNPEELALWNTDTSVKGKFNDLKHWCEDPTVGVLTVVSEQTTTQANSEAVFFGWLSSSGIPGDIDPGPPV